MQNKLKNDMEVEGAYAELLTPRSELPQPGEGQPTRIPLIPTIPSLQEERRKKKRELKNKAALENLCMLNGERRKIIPRRLDMDALDDTNDETESMWRYDLHGMVVIADATKRVIDSWDNNGGVNNNCLRQVRFNDSERQTKARDKMRDMQRKRERDRKDLRVRFYERNA